MTGIKFEIKDRREIENLGFKYAADESKCTEYVFTRLPLKMDVRDHPKYKLNDIERDVDMIFRKVLKKELKDAGIKKVRKIEWDRIFQIGEEWNPRHFTAIFYARILCEDAPNHI